MANQYSNTLLNLGKSIDMINDVMSLHQDYRPGCRGPLQQFLPRSKCFNTIFSQERDQAPCLHLIKLSPAVLDRTIKNTDSQNVENFNKTLHHSLPRNVTFTRNFAGRAHRVIHSSNHGPGRSVRALCTGVGTSISSGGQVEQILEKILKRL